MRKGPKYNDIMLQWSNWILNYIIFWEYCIKILGLELNRKVEDTDITNKNV